MIRSRLLMGLCLLGTLLILLPAFDGSAYAQKKKTDTKQIAPEPATPAPQPAKTSGATLKEFLTKYKGAKTNLGMLVRVEADHFVVEDEGISTIYPISNIDYLRITKPEPDEENPVLLRISMK